MRKLALTLVFLGFGCAAAALALKAFAPGEKGEVALSAGETVELDGAMLLLDSFAVPKYPSGKPRQFESDVHVIDPSSRDAVHAVISVNHPLIWNGWWIYQTSYDSVSEQYTQLTAFRDPWLPLATVGGALLLLGALLLAFGRAPEPASVDISRWGRMVRCLFAVMVIAAPLAIVARAVFRAEPIPALQSPLLAPHVAAYVASYLIVIFSAFGVGRRFLPLGYFLMTLGLVLGAVWGKLCWTDFWQYDPKEMWSLATWLCYTAYFLFLKRPRSELVLRVLTAVMVLFTATGVNLMRCFAGLHSYR